MEGRFFFFFFKVYMGPLRRCQGESLATRSGNRDQGTGRELALPGSPSQTLVRPGDGAGQTAGISPAARCRALGSLWASPAARGRALSEQGSKAVLARLLGRGRG